MHEDPAAFALAEYSALRNEILVRISASQALERNVFVADVIVAGFLYLHSPLHNWQRGAWLLPFAITALGFLRGLADEQVFRLFGTYIERIEVRFNADAGGWERFRVASPPRMFGLTVEAFWRGVFWGSLVAVTGMIAFFGIFKLIG